MKPFIDTLFHSGSPAVIAAPLAGVTDQAFQQILHDCRTPVISTEMIPAAALSKHPKGLKKLVRYKSGIHPMNVQLFGNTPEQLVRTIDLISCFEPDNIDINMGCPARKIFNNAAGLALMNDLPRATAIIRAVRRHFPGSISIKIRLGIKPGDFKASIFAQMAESEGVDFITVHGRYRTGYTERADWNSIARVKSSVSIPVVGNGDIFSPEDARFFLQLSGCDGVMIARGLLGNPWLPARIHSYLTTGLVSPDPSVRDRFRMFSRHLDYHIELYGTKKGSLIFRKHAAWYLRGFPYISQYRKKLFSLTEPSEFYRLAMEIFLLSRIVAIPN
jgi:tRNA-dihydrouridine synthase B